MSIGIAMSGGGARGIAYIGVLHALNENGIYPDHVSGSSAGSIIAPYIAMDILLRKYWNCHTKKRS